MFLKIKLSERMSLDTNLMETDMTHPVIEDLNRSIISTALLGCASNEKLQVYAANEALVKTYLENFNAGRDDAPSCLR